MKLTRSQIEYALSERNKLIGSEKYKGPRETEKQRERERERERSRRANGIYSGNTSSACRGIKIFWFLHGLVMEALSRDGSSFRRESFGVVVRDGQRSVCKAFFSLSFSLSRELLRYLRSTNETQPALPFRRFVSSLLIERHSLVLLLLPPSIVSNVTKRNVRQDIILISLSFISFRFVSLRFDESKKIRNRLEREIELGDCNKDGSTRRTKKRR